VAKRLARLRIVALRVASSLASGLVGGFAGYRVGALACLGAASAAALLYLAAGIYAERYVEKGVIKPSEKWTAGALSAATGFLVGLYLGSALGFP